MNYLDLDIALAQLLAYFVSEKGYTIVSVQQDRDDLWLIQPRNRNYPILRLCRESREELRRKQNYLRQVNRAICDLIHRESKIVVINVDGGAESFEDEEIRQVALLRNDDAAFARAFPDARGHLHKVEDARAELNRLSRQLEETRHRTSLWRTLVAMLPHKGMFVFAVLIALSLLCSYAGIDAGFHREAVLSQHALWQLLSCSLIIGTPWALFQLPALFTLLMGADDLLPRRFAAAGCFGVLAGGLCLLLSGAQEAAAMPSALIAALWSAVCCELCLTRFWRFSFMRTYLLRLSIWCVIALLVPGAELAAAAGAAIAGALCVWISHLHERRDPRFIHVLMASLLLLGGIGAIAWF